MNRHTRRWRVACRRRGWGIVLAGLLIVSVSLLPFRMMTKAEVGELPNPPVLKWSVWFPMALTPPVFPIPLPDPIRGSGLAVLAWFRTPEGLYAPMARLLNGANGTVTDEVRGLPAIFPAAATLLDTDMDGLLREIVAGDGGHIVDIDLERGQVRWEWNPPSPGSQPLAGPPAFTAEPTPFLIALDWGGSIYGLNPANGSEVWKVQGHGNSSQASTPSVTALGGVRVVAATESANLNESWVVTKPPQLRLVGLDSRQVRWTVPLFHDPLAAPTVVHAGSNEDPLVVFFDFNFTTGSPATQRAFAVSASTGIVRWNTTWEGHVFGHPESPSLVVDGPRGPTLFAPGEEGRILRVGALNGTLTEVATPCGKPPTAPDSLSELFPIDFLGDGAPELLGVSSSGKVCVFAVPNLDVLWSYNASHNYRLNPALGDIDQDGKPELVVISEDGYVTAFDINPLSPIQNPSWPVPALLGLGIAVVGVAVLAAWVVWRRRRRPGADESRPEEEPRGGPASRHPLAKGKP